MLGVLAYGDTLGTAHKECNVINPRHEPLPSQEQADCLEDAIL